MSATGGRDRARRLALRGNTTCLSWEHADSAVWGPRSSARSQRASRLIARSRSSSFTATTDIRSFARGRFDAAQRSVIRAVLDGIGLTEEQRERAIAILVVELRRVAGEEP